MISASRSDALWECAYQFKPGLALMWDAPSVGGATGTGFHAVAEAHNDGVDPQSVALPPLADATRVWRMFDLWREWWPSYRPGMAWETEVPFAYSLTTGKGRRLPMLGQRNYRSAARDELPGTADVFTLERDHAIILDWKTGKPQYITPARESRQLMTLALAATRAHNVDSATVVIVPVSDMAPPHADEHHVDALDLDLYEDELRAKVASIPTSKPTPGEHCRFCRHRHLCEAAPAKFRNEGKKRVA